MYWWNENAAGIQAVTAIVIAFLTFALVGVTYWYARLTKSMALTLREQLAASFQPNVEMKLTHRLTAQGSDGCGGYSENISGTIMVHNKGNLPLKVVTVTMKLIYANAAFPVQVRTLNAKQLVLAPNEMTHFDLTVEVPPGGSAASHQQIVQIHCSDLAGVSKHCFWVSSREKDRTCHSSGFQEI